MKATKKHIFSIIMFCTAMLLSVVARPSYDIEKMLLINTLIILIGGLAISVTTTIWSTKNSKTAFTNSLKLSFGLSALLFIFGYICVALHPVILK